MKQTLYIFLMWFMATAVYGQQIDTRPNVRDTKISSRDDSLNYGTSTYFRVGSDTVGVNDTLRVLFYSDIIETLVPSNVTIDSLKVIAYVCSTGSGDSTKGAGVISLFPLDSLFREGDSAAAEDTANWNYRDLIGNVINAAWNPPGGDYAAAALDSQAFTMATDSIIFFDDSLTAWANRVRLGTQTNSGWLFKIGDELSNNRIHFVSSDSTGAGWRIQIWYTIPSPSYANRLQQWDSTGTRTWTDNNNITVGNADTAGYATSAGTIAGAIDTAKYAWRADTVGTHPADSMATLAALADSIAAHPPGVSEDTLYFKIPASQLPISFQSTDYKTSAWDSTIIGDSIYQVIWFAYDSTDAGLKAINFTMMFSMPHNMVALDELSLWISGNTADTTKAKMSYYTRTDVSTSVIASHIGKGRIGNVPDSLNTMPLTGTWTQGSTLVVVGTVSVSYQYNLRLHYAVLRGRYYED